jgi:cytochrome c oxidase subunit 2
VILGALWAVTPGSPSGEVQPSATGVSRRAGATVSPLAEAPVDPALMKLGKSVYADTCSKCHQSNGKGIPGAFPPLADNPNLKKVEMVVTTVKSGHSGPINIKGREFDQTMPPMGADLSNKQLAAVATYIRNSWGNKFGGVTEKQVAEIVSKQEPSDR